MPIVARRFIIYARRRLSNPHKLMASLGNGYIGVQISFPVMYIARLFNGRRCLISSDAPREIEAPLNLKVDMTVKGAALDIRHATYLRRHQASSGPTIERRGTRRGGRTAASSWSSRRLPTAIKARASSSAVG